MSAAMRETMAGGGKANLMVFVSRLAKIQDFANTILSNTLGTEMMILIILHTVKFIIPSLKRVS